MNVVLIFMAISLTETQSRKRQTDDYDILLSYIPVNEKDDEADNKLERTKTSNFNEDTYYQLSSRIIKDKGLNLRKRRPPIPIRSLEYGSTKEKNTENNFRRTGEQAAVGVVWKPDTFNVVVRRQVNTTSHSKANQCGIPYTPKDDEGIGFRIVGGNSAKLGSWPWIAALGYKVDNDEHRVNFRCGGTLITQKHVLTAAHCIQDRPELYLVRLGELDLASNEDGASPRDIKIEKTIIHEDYNATAFSNDIAIIYLEVRILFTDLIRPACLPLSDEIRQQNFTTHKPLIAGWGTIKFMGETSQKLQELPVPVVNTSICQSVYDGFGTVIDERSICAGYGTGGQDACQGDSGGPLVWPYKGVYYVIGIVSYGYHCAEAGFPGVYTRVTSYTDWIIRNLNIRKNST